MRDSLMCVFEGGDIASEKRMLNFQVGKQEERKFIS